MTIKNERKNMTDITRHSKQALITMLLISASITPLLWNNEASAADAKGNFAVYGLGNTSCHRYNKTRLESPDDKAYYHYTSAYLTLYNETTDKTFSIAGKLSIEDVLAEMDAICSDQQILGFHEALGIVMMVFYPQRLQRAADRYR